jgi:hypothetical protein
VSLHPLSAADQFVLSVRRAVMSAKVKIPEDSGSNPSLILTPWAIA